MNTARRVVPIPAVEALTKRLRETMGAQTAAFERLQILLDAHHIGSADREAEALERIGSDRAMCIDAIQETLDELGDHADTIEATRLRIAIREARS